MGTFSAAIHACFPTLSATHRQWDLSIDIKRINAVVVGSRFTLCIYQKLRAARIHNVFKYLDYSRSRLIYMNSLKTC
jgi:hypothetical protein